MLERPKDYTSRGLEMRRSDEIFKEGKVSILSGYIGDRQQLTRHSSAREHTLDGDQTALLFLKQSIQPTAGLKSWALRESSSWCPWCADALWQRILYILDRQSCDVV